MEIVSPNIILATVPSIFRPRFLDEDNILQAKCNMAGKEHRLKKPIKCRDSRVLHNLVLKKKSLNIILLIIPPHNEVVGGILVSLRPSVCPSFVPAFRVPSVAPTVLVGSILYYTCYQATLEGVSRVNIFTKLQNMNFWQCLKFAISTLSCFDSGSDVNP